MIPPAVAAQHFAVACLLGLPLGFVYGFLRPLRQKLPSLGDGLFLILLFAVWLVLGFQVCDGDLRPGYWAGLAAGSFLWELTVGQLLRPLFYKFWGLLFRIIGLPPRFFRKIFKKIHIFKKSYWQMKKNRVQ